MTATFRQQRLQLIKRIARGEADNPTVAAAPTPKPKLPLRRRWGLTPMIPLGESFRHRALPNHMFTTLRSRT